ncbi:MAG: FAD-dependent oxidoreductase [Legionella sp.]
MAKDTDVLVIGAGPIGLLNAWGMKQLNPKLKIVVLEKYEKYQRSHTLIMQPQHLEAIMKATHTDDHPVLSKLLAQLRNDPHIRTNTLQEILTKLAQDSGVEIQTKQEVKEDEIKKKIAEEYHNVRLIVGADGTHSVVGQTLYPKGNQVRNVYDHVLQLRFDIDGEEKAPGINTQAFYQQMARKGLIGNEYMGNFENGKTPVTVQLVISKEDFLQLKKATSRDPLKPFAKISPTASTPNAPELPPHLQSFITTYLKYKVRDTDQVDQKIDQASIRISVNETTAAHVKQAVNKLGNARVILKGDAALSLSYWKGLNAGNEASARFLTMMEPAIKDSFQDTELRDECLDSYHDWFVNDYSPKKIKEVSNYSFWQVRSFLQTMKVIRSIKLASVKEDDDDLEPAIRDYFNHYTRDPLAKGAEHEWRPFPHREYDIVKFAQWDYIPLKHTAKKIGKLFADFFKPYKSTHQLTQDFKQPFVGIGNLAMGFVKVIVGVFTLNGWRVADGLFSMVRGAIELVTTPLAWFIKPITRGIATAIHGGYKKIEENSGIQSLAQFGQEFLNEKDDEELKSSQTIYELLAVCNDLHRKFDKQAHRGQASTMEFEEFSMYATIRADTALDRKKLIRYFSLFAPSKEIDTDDSEFTSTLQLGSDSL